MELVQRGRIHANVSFIVYAGKFDYISYIINYYYFIKLHFYMVVTNLKIT